MIKKTFKVILIALLANIINFKCEEVKINRLFDRVYLEMKSESINVIEGEEIYLVFNYEKVLKIINSNFENYNLYKKSESEFIVEVVIKRSFIEKKVAERYLIMKGKIYEKFN